MADYIDTGICGAPGVVEEFLRGFGWRPDDEERVPYAEGIAGFTRPALAVIDGKTLKFILIVSTDPLMLPEGISAAPAWMTSAAVGGIATAPPISPISRRQLLLGLASQGLITPEEALAAAQTGAVPASVEAIFLMLPPDQQLGARITWASMSQAERNNPLVAMMAAARGISGQQLDALWVEWAAL